MTARQPTPETDALFMVLPRGLGAALAKMMEHAQKLERERDALKAARPEALRSGEMPSDACRAALANIMARIDGDEFVPTEYKEDARAALAGKRAPFTSDDVIPTIVDWRGLIASKEGGSRVTLVDAIGIGDQLVSALIEETGRRKRAEILLQAMNGHYVRSPRGKQ